MIYAFFIGSLPLLTTSPEEVSVLVTALLPPELMAYYVYLLIAFAIVSIITLRVTFRSFHHHWKVAGSAHVLHQRRR